MVVSLDSGAVPRQLFKARGGSGALRWSPDGGKLAFVSNRERHSFLGVYDLGAKTLPWIDPSVDQDGEPAWSPDGKRIAYMRSPSQFTDQMFIAEREGDPWSIRVADVATGVGREVWRADKGPGSVFRERRRAEPAHLEQRRSDRLPVGEGRLDPSLQHSRLRRAGPVLLTPGDGEVEHVSVAENGRTILYSSNIGDIDRRDVWRVNAAGGARGAAHPRERHRVGRGRRRRAAGDAPTPTRSSRRGPALLGGDEGEARDLAPETMPADFPAARLVEPQPVMITATDGMHVPGAALPAARSPPGREASRRHLLPWRFAAADAAGLELRQLLPQGVRAAAVLREPGLHRALGELPERDRLRAQLPRGAQLRRRRRERIRRRDGRRAVSARPGRRRSLEDRALGRFVRRVSHRDGAFPRVGPVRGRRGHSRRARLEPGDSRVHPDLRSAPAGGDGEARVRSRRRCRR